MTYNLFILLHVIAAVGYAGAQFSCHYFMHRAKASRNPVVLEHTLKGVTGMGRYLVMPAAVLLLLGGSVQAMLGGYSIHRTGWIILPFFLLLLSAFFMMWKLSPIQKAMRTALGSGSDWDEIQEKAAGWLNWSLLNLLVTLLALAMMVMKVPA